MAENVVEIPLTPRMAERLLRQAVEDSSKLVNTITYGSTEAWYELVSNRQVIQCLKKGRVIETPAKDEHGNWIAVSYRLCGGSDVYVTTAIELSDDWTVKTVYVLNVDNRFRL